MGRQPVAPADDPEALRLALRDAMAAVCTPVAVVTTMAGTRPYGTTVSAFASLSMEPPMVLVSLDQRSGLLAEIRRTRGFGLNVLSSDQAQLAQIFARSGADGFATTSWVAHAGVPRLPGATSFVVCQVPQLIRAGDHVLVLGLVCDAETGPGSPLTYHRRAYGSHATLADAKR